jgi:ketosteroid isomerase-like protein
MDLCLTSGEVQRLQSRPNNRGRTNMSESNKKTALAFLDAMNGGDANAAERCITADAFTVSKGFGKVSGRRDRAAMLGTMSAFKELVPTGFRPTFHTIISEGNTVVLEFDGDAELKNGAPYRNQYCMVFTFEGDRIKQLNEYFCTVLADEVMLPLLMEQGSEVAWT